MTHLNKGLVERIIGSAEGVTFDEAVEIAGEMPQRELLDIAEAVTRRCVPKKFDSCSIINAKSGKCPENCHWCAQSAHHHTGVTEYGLLDAQTMLKAALACSQRGIGRFSFVTSGRRLSKEEVSRVCDAAVLIKSNCGISLCISAGLLDYEDFCRLKEAGITRCHCNLETAPSYFGSLCTTHTHQQKMETMRSALKAGMDVCSGGIIGMGETMTQRIELAFTLKELGVNSIPINVLNPIKGTPLENAEPLSDEELLRTIALFRLIMPTAYLRFAGGVARFSESTLKEAYRAGINAAIIGDMLTTAGADVDSNIRIIKGCGYEF